MTAIWIDAREAVGNAIAAVDITTDKQSLAVLPPKEAVGDVKTNPDPEKGRPTPDPKSSLDKRFKIYLESSGFLRRLQEAAITNDAYLTRECTSSYNVTLSEAKRQTKPTFKMAEDTPHPSAGVWHVSYTSRRCGETALYRAIFGGRTDAPPNMRISTPGNSTAPRGIARQIRAKIKNVAMAAAGLQHCKDRRIVDTRSEPQEKDVRNNEIEWRQRTAETWKLDICGRLVEIAVHHGLRVGMQKPHFTIIEAPEVQWTPSGRITPKEIDLPRLEAALTKVAAGDSRASLDYLWSEARREVPFAQTVIAGLLRDGKIGEVDMDRAAYWALRAAYGGYPAAMEMVGDIYASGSWVVVDRRLAAAWYRRAVERGATSAKEKLDALATTQLR